MDGKGKWEGAVTGSVEAVANRQVNVIAAASIHRGTLCATVCNRRTTWHLCVSNMVGLHVCGLAKTQSA